MMIRNVSVVASAQAREAPARLAGYRGLLLTDVVPAIQ